jgi:hypothetical protein
MKSWKRGRDAEVRVGRKKLMRWSRFSTVMYVERAMTGRTTARLERLKIVLLILQNDYRYKTFLN